MTKLTVEPITEPILAIFPAIISEPGMKEVKAETTEEYNRIKKKTRVNSRERSFIPVCFNLFLRS